MAIPSKPTEQHQYSLNKEGAFIISDYNNIRPFSNFFPGIAGLWGIPMWVFYVNRGQCISSFGIESKDKSILEFQPANKAYRLAELQGFRTFLKIGAGIKTIFYEPFQNNPTSPYKSKQKMSITSHDLTIEETNDSLGLSVIVNYFTLPEEPIPALVRQVTFKNISRTVQTLEIIDGLPVINPYGTTDWILKNMSRTAEAWINVNNLKRRAPYYHLKVVVSDKPAITHIREGNFYFAFDPQSQDSKLLEPIVESACVFGNSNSFLVPEKFLKESNFKVPNDQETSNRTPCAMAHAKFKLPPGGEKKIISLAGYAHDESELNRIVIQVIQEGYIDAKAVRNRDIIEKIKNFACTNSSSSEFNLYCAQTFLDNVLRGGLPVSLKTVDGTAALNVYSRKHGDPERDYNHFVLAPTYFSQGNGNYRDVNQNRRNDVWFNNHVSDNSIINFMNMIQADGYNPLIVKGMSFHVDDPHKTEMILKECIDEEGWDAVRVILKQGFQSGELLRLVTLNGIKLKVSPREFMDKVLCHCHSNVLAEHGEGFWTDHWAYNLDLLESYLTLYPEELKNIFYRKKVFTFYQNSFYVLPRDERTILTPAGVRQYHSLGELPRDHRPVARGNKLRTKNGEGPIYYTNLLVKLLSLAANKAATFDPSAVGIEMEADKPNWYDALNGLPGLMGSSISETLELGRLCELILDSIKKLNLNDDLNIPIFEELAAFITNLSYEYSLESNPQVVWTKANELKEQYRHRVRAGIDGRENEISVAEIKEFIELVLAKTRKALDRVRREDGLIPTYFTHEVLQYRSLERKLNEEFYYVRPTSFKMHTLPLFLEGLVHALRVEKDQAAAKKVYHAVKKSPLYDKELKMYKVNCDLSGESEEIGRTRIFPPGWLENESIWLHMEYKFMLEVLRCGLYEEFYQDFKCVLVPFLDPRTYGRSILENSSFIVSSAHKDKDLHGQGFVARLSGSTAELLHIWLIMNAGPHPFQLDEKGELSLTFKPILQGWLFTEEKSTIMVCDKDHQWQEAHVPANSYAFNFLGSTLVVYHNPKRKDTFGPKEAQVKKIELTYPLQKQHVVIPSESIPIPYAQDIREHKVGRIDVFFD